MNLAIEYIKRTKITQQMLKLPCSLFINYVFKNNNPIVITLHNCYGKPEEVVVKHWLLGNANKERILPPVEEFVVNRNEIFNSPFVVLDDYNVIDYVANPYPVYAKQSSDEPYASNQEKQYQECLDRFFNNSNHNIKRYDWLWKHFLTTFFPESMETDFCDLTPEQQREVIRELCPIPWKGWGMWINHMFCETQSQIATELAFEINYQKKLETNEKYQKLFLPKLVKSTKNKNLNIYNVNSANLINFEIYSPTNNQSFEHIDIDFQFDTTN